MQLTSFFSTWTKAAGLLLMGGALAWTIKLGVIISTDGRIIDTGAAALCMKIGLVMLVIGSTGIGNRLSLRRSLWLRVLAILLSPVMLAGLLFLIGMITSPLFGNSKIWYAQQEAPIAVAIVVCLAVGCLLYRSYRTIAR